MISHCVGIVDARCDVIPLKKAFQEYQHRETGLAATVRRICAAQIIMHFSPLP